MRASQPRKYQEDAKIKPKAAEMDSNNSEIKFKQLLRIFNNDYAILYLKVQPHLSMEKKLFLKVPALKGEVDSKTIVFEDGGVLPHCMGYCCYMGKEPPPNFFFQKKFSSPLKRDSLLNYLFQRYCKTILNFR